MFGAPLSGKKKKKKALVQQCLMLDNTKLYTLKFRSTSESTHQATDFFSSFLQCGKNNGPQYAHTLIPETHEGIDSPTWHRAWA